jgi:hypothetical protein
VLVVVLVVVVEPLALSPSKFDDETGIGKSRVFFGAKSPCAHEVGVCRGLRAGLSGRGLISLVTVRQCATLV